MRSSTILVGALLGLVAATPLSKRQDIDLDTVDAADPVDLTTPPVDVTADPGSYSASDANAAAAADPITPDDGAASKSKRDADDCSAQPKGYGPVSSPDTAKAFLADLQFGRIAQAAKQPIGYSQAFGSLQGATQSPSYITYKVLQSYDTQACANFCDATSSCYFFNIFMERDPSLKPAAACQNPASLTYFKCSLFGAQQTNSTATNVGQWRQQFQVAIAGSNGYNKNAPPAAASGFQAPVALAGAINAPDNSYMGVKYYPGPYNPAQCAAACQATTAYNSRHPRSDGTYDTCAFFNSYVLNKNYAPQGTYCSMYSKSWSNQYATNIGQWRGSDWYSVSQSYGWTLNQ